MPVTFKAYLIVILSLGTFLLTGCGGSAPGSAGKAKIGAVQLPVLLRYKWRPGQTLTYSFVRGLKGDPALSDGSRYILTCRKAGPKGVELDYRSAEEVQVDESAPPEILAYRVIIDRQGIVVGVPAAPRHEIIPKDSIAGLIKPIDGARGLAGFIGNPTTDIKIGVLSYCLLPSKPVGVGSEWKQQIRAPELPPSAPLHALYVGKLLRLVRNHDRVCALIQADLYFPTIRPPYRAYVQFDILEGQVVSVDWQSLPGVDALYAPFAGGQKVHISVHEELVGG